MLLISDCKNENNYRESDAVTSYKIRFVIFLTHLIFIKNKRLII
jgi:hypothetical protein